MFGGVFGCLYCAARAVARLDDGTKLHGAISVKSGDVVAGFQVACGLLRWTSWNRFVIARCRARTLDVFFCKSSDYVGHYIY